MVSHTSPLSIIYLSVGSITPATSSNSSNSITSLSLRLQQIHLHLFYAAQLGLIFFGFTYSEPIELQFAKLLLGKTS